MTSPTPYQLLPRLSDEEYEALKNDIAENGVRVPIDVDENGTILDGHHRSWITADLGVECPRRTVAGLSEEQKRTHAVAVNVHRRSLTREQRRNLVARLRADGMTQQRISQLTGIPQPTVSRDLGVIQVNNSDLPETITDSLGRQQPATKPRPAPEPPSDDDLLAGDDWVQLDGPGFEATVTPQPVAPKPKRRPLPEAFTDAGRDLTRAAERLARLTEDDRFPKNRDTTHHQMPELLGALDNTTQLIQAMRLDQTAASEEARRWWATSLRKISDALADVANSIEQEK